MSSSKHVAFRIISIALLAAFGVACEAADPEVKNPGGGGAAGAGFVTCNANEGVVDMSGSMCKPLADDYTPRDNASANDTWPACISDGNKYVPFDLNNSAVARVAAFEKISELLEFGGLEVPSSQDFLDARVQYSLADGIEFHVARCEDDHYPAAPKLCQDMTADEQAQYPDRCVGPIRIRAILHAAFESGIKGEEPMLNAARIESALLWFFYISTYKEAVAAAETSVRTDSSWAYYTGGESRENPIAFAKYVQERSQEAHDRIGDALLAVRCWRDLDNPTGPAMDPVLQNRAVAQLDRALIRGMALILRQRVQVRSCEVAWESAEILGGVLRREAKARDSVQAAIFEEEISRRDATLVDGAKLTAAIDALFPCP